MANHVHVFEGVNVSDILNDLSKVMPDLNPKDRSFAAKLHTAYINFKGLTYKQAYWANELLKRGLGITKSNPGTEDLGNFEGVINLFHTAKSNLKWPKIRLQDINGKPVVLSLAGEKSKYPGTVNVTDGGKFGDNIWYGRINKDGTWQKSFKATEEVGELLKKLAENPAEMAQMQGKKFGNCCFCSRTLTDHRSVTVGFGPVCAEKWGLKLQWDAAAKQAGV